MEKQKYKNRFYEIKVLLPGDPVTLDLPVGVSQQGSVNIVNVPFILKRITHRIIGSNQLVAFPNNLLQDGQYDIEWRTDQHNYQTAPINAVLMCGSAEHWIPLETPEELAPKTTITAIVSNTILRPLDPGSLLVQLVWHGLEPIGWVAPNRE